MSDLGRFDRLFEKYIDGTLSEEEENELCRLAEADTHLACRLAERLRQHSQLARLQLDGVLARMREELPAGPASVRKPVLRRIAWISIAACITLIVGALAYDHYQERKFMDNIVARIVEAGGRVSVRRGDVVVIAIPGSGILPGDMLATSPDGNITLRYDGEETLVRMKKNTIVGVLEAAGKTLRVDAGEIEASVAPQPKDRPMIVTTAHARVEVLGTRFTLAARPGATRVEVEEGLVRFSRADSDQSIDLAEGYGAEALSSQKEIVTVKTPAGTTGAALPAHVNPHTGSVRRTDTFEFAKKPAVEKKGDTYVITFAVTAACDTTVSIIDTNGRIVRHLASGVLGANAPWPFEQNSLDQAVEWDGSDDLGQSVPPGCSARVSLGFTPKHAGIFLDEKGVLPGSEEVVQGMAVGADGLLYVHYGWQRLAAIGRDAAVARQILPMGADGLAKAEGTTMATRPGGERFPLLPWGHLGGIKIPPLYPAPGTDPRGTNKILDLVVTKAGVIYSAWMLDLPKDPKKGRSGDQFLQCLLRVGANGALPRNYYGPAVQEFKHSYHASRCTSPVWCALSPDERSVYVSGTTGRNGEGPRHCVYRVPLDNRTAPTPFAGDPATAGGDETHFSWPRGIAVGPAGNVYVADYLNDRVVVLDNTGSFLKALPVDRPECVGLGPRGEIYVITYKFKPEQEPKDLWKQKDGYPLAFSATPMAAKKLVKLSPEGKVLASLDLPNTVKIINGMIGVCDSPKLAVDAAADPVIVWIGSAGPREPIWKVEDKNNTLVKTATVPALPGLVLATDHRPSLAANPLRAECFVRVRGGKTGLARISAGGKIEELPAPGGAGYIIPAPDGSYWVGSRGDITHLDGKGNPIPGHRALPAPQVHAAEWKALRSSWAAPNGDLYLAYNLLSKGAGFESLRGGDPPPAFPSRTHPCEVWRFGPDGTLKSKGLLKGFSHRATCVRVDRAGCLYLADGDFEPDDALPIGLAGVTKTWKKPFWKKATGSILKFVPGGGEVTYAPFKSYRSHLPATFKGLLWKIYGYSPNPTEADGLLECMCGSGSFTLDGYGRVLMPDIHTFAVHLLDANGNLIRTFGSYGNIQDRGPDIRFTIVPHVAASSGDFWLADEILNRVVRVAWSYAVEETAPIP
ncbi:FecR domain-containing protein [Planctomycetota bacterium]